MTDHDTRQTKEIEVSESRRDSQSVFISYSIKEDSTMAVVPSSDHDSASASVENSHLHDNSNPAQSQAQIPEIKSQELLVNDDVRPIPTGCLVLLLITISLLGGCWTYVVCIQEVFDVVKHSKLIGTLNILEPITLMLIVSYPITTLFGDTVIYASNSELISHPYLCLSIIIMVCLPVLEFFFTFIHRDNNATGVNLPYQMTKLALRATLFSLGSIYLHRSLTMYYFILKQHVQEHFNINVWKRWLKIHLLLGAPWLMVEEIRWMLGILNGYDRTLTSFMYITIVIYPLFWLSYFQRTIERQRDNPDVRRGWISNLDVIAILIGLSFLIMNVFAHK